ncbi:hypothetical protein VXS06_14415 [Photobacterium toruni]|uniref:Uncharacterized protein n=1 Tax=Photobacterium toruni TaxID=1935446 RepID=A0ABU6L8Q2_9GAMM|nr:hypothetical protein [Photobacterium toruni]
MNIKRVIFTLTIALLSVPTIAADMNPIKFGDSIEKIKSEHICSFSDLAPSGISDQVIFCGDYKFNGTTYPLMVFGIDDKAEKSVIVFNQDLVNDGLKYLSELGEAPTYADSQESFDTINTAPNKKAAIELNNGTTKYTMQSDSNGYVSATLSFSSPLFLKAELDPNAQVNVKSSTNDKEQSFLQELNGVWATYVESYQLKLNGKSPYMVVNGTAKYPLTVKGIDYDNQIVHLQIKVKKAVVMNIYIRKIDSKQDNSFFLSISIDDEAPKIMNFVRNL